MAAEGAQAAGSGRASGDPAALVAAAESVAAGWVLELSCCCLCRHFAEGRAAEFRRWRAVAEGEGAPSVPSPSGRGCRSPQWGRVAALRRLGEPPSCWVLRAGSARPDSITLVL